MGNHQRSESTVKPYYLLWNERYKLRPRTISRLIMPRGIRLGQSLTSSSCQIILRNENFTPPAIGGHDRANYLKLTSTRNLLGRAGQLFLLFGMLSRDPQGKLCLEDGEGRAVLDMEDAVSVTELESKHANNLALERIS